MAFRLSSDDLKREYVSFNNECIRQGIPPSEYNEYWNRILQEDAFGKLLLPPIQKRKRIESVRGAAPPATPPTENTRMPVTDDDGNDIDTPTCPSGCGNPLPWSSTCGDEWHYECEPEPDSSDDDEAMDAGLQAWMDTIDGSMLDLTPAALGASSVVSSQPGAPTPGASTPSSPNPAVPAKKRCKAYNLKAVWWFLTVYHPDVVKVGDDLTPLIAIANRIFLDKDVAKEFSIRQAKGQIEHGNGDESKGQPPHPHIQAIVHSKGQCRGSHIHDFVGREIWLQPQDKKWASKYVTKTEGRLAGPWQLFPDGKVTAQGSRTDIGVVVKAIRDGKSPDEILVDFPEAWIKFPRVETWHARWNSISNKKLTEVKLQINIGGTLLINLDSSSKVKKRSYLICGPADIGKSFPFNTLKKTHKLWQLSGEKYLFEGITTETMLFADDKKYWGKAALDEIVAALNQDSAGADYVGEQRNSKQWVFLPNVIRTGYFVCNWEGLPPFHRREAFRSRFTKVWMYDEAPPVSQGGLDEWVHRKAIPNWWALPPTSQPVPAPLT